MNRPLVSVLIVVRNGSQDIIGALDSIRGQDYTPLEVLVVDGMSGDGTKSLAENYARNNPGLAVRVLENPGLIQASGWNIGIRAAKGTYVLRLDAVHCRLQPDYVRRCLETLLRLQESDAKVAATGGRRVSLARFGSRWSEAIAAAQRSPFGVGNATYRLGSKSGFTDTLGVPVYDQRILLEVGLFNESLGRSEDNELHMRLRQQGYKLYFLADAVAVYHPRDTLRAIAGQMFHNGWWVSATILRLRSFPFGSRHLVPFVFWTALLLTGLLGAFSFVTRVFCLGLLAIYVLSSLAAALQVSRSLQFWRVAVVFWTMHLCYAAGTATGIFAGGKCPLASQAALPGTGVGAT